MKDLFELWSEWAEWQHDLPPVRAYIDGLEPKAKKKREPETGSMLVLDRPERPAQLWAPNDHHRSGASKLGFPEAARTPFCTPTVIALIGHAEYRGACMGCGWVSDRPMATATDAAFAAHDHTHPGWSEWPRIKDLSTAAGQDLKSSRKEWVEKVAPMFPEGWFDRSGPVVTMRKGAAMANAIPGGGYDLPGLSSTAPTRKRLRGEKVHLLAPPPKLDRWGCARGGEWDSMVFDPETNQVVSVPALRQREDRKRREAEAAAKAAAGETAPVEDDDERCPECGDKLDDCGCYGDDD